MRTIEYLRRKAKDQDFPLKVAGAGLLAALGGPLVLVPALGYIAVDAIVTALDMVPGTLGDAVRIPGAIIEQSRKVATMHAEERRGQAERLALDIRRQEEETERQHRAEIALIDARYEVIGFYDTHRRELAETLPLALFRTQLQTRFSQDVSSDRSWLTAREMISEMLPLIAAGRERLAAADAELRKQSEAREAADKVQRELENSRHAVGRLTQWYEREKSRIWELISDSDHREVVLMGLYERYDQLLKEALQEMRP